MDENSPVEFLIKKLKEQLEAYLQMASGIIYINS